MLFDKKMQGLYFEEFYWLTKFSRTVGVEIRVQRVKMPKVGVCEQNENNQEEAKD